MDDSINVTHLSVGNYSEQNTIIIQVCQWARLDHTIYCNFSVIQLHLQ